MNDQLKSLLDEALEYFNDKLEISSQAGAFLIGNKITVYDTEGEEIGKFTPEEFINSYYKKSY